MTGLLAAVRLGSAGRLDYPPHMGSHKWQFFDGMICSKIRDVQILISVVGGTFKYGVSERHACRLVN
jgi:hypothetical protein